MPENDHLTCKGSAVGEAQKQAGSHNQRISGKTAAGLLVAGAYALGGGGMAAWLLFVFRGPWFGPAAGVGVAERLLLDGLLCLLFFIQHSVMVRRGFRIWLTRSVRADLHGALYASASGVCLLVLVVLWQPVGEILWMPPDWFRWTMAGVFLMAGAGAWWGSRALGEFDALGVRPAIDIFRRRQSDAPMELTIRGPYRWVRHPLYLLSLVIIWAGPVYTPDRVLHNLLWSVWIVIAADFEESDLVACFGDAYRSYRKAVPKLVPRSLRPLVPESRHRAPAAR